MSNCTELSQRLLIGLYCESIFESGAFQEMRWKAVHNCDALSIFFWWELCSTLQFYALHITLYSVLCYLDVLKCDYVWRHYRNDDRLGSKTWLEASIRCEIPLRFNGTYSPISHTYPITVFLSSISQSCKWNLPF